MRLSGISALAVACGAVAFGALVAPSSGQISAGRSAAQSKPSVAPTERPAIPSTVATPYKAGQAVEVRYGKIWRAATVVGVETFNTKVRYPDGSEEWAVPPRVRYPEAAPATRRTEFAIGEKVESQSGQRWSEGTIKAHEGDLYLVIPDFTPNQPNWEWVHRVMVRSRDDKSYDGPALTAVRLGRDAPAVAKARALKSFVNFEERWATDRAIAEHVEARRHGDLGMHDIIRSTRPVTAVATTGSREVAVAAAPLKLAPAGPVAPVAAVRPSARPILLDAEQGKTDLYFGGPYAMVAHKRGYESDLYGLSVERVTLATGAIEPAVEWDFLSVPCSVSPTGRQVLGQVPSAGMTKPNRLDLWDWPPAAVPAAGGNGRPAAAVKLKPTPVVTFAPYGSEFDDEQGIAWAALTTDNRAVTHSAAGRLDCWALGPKSVTAVWRLAVPVRGAVALSPDRKRLACVTASGLAVLDAATGQTLAAVAKARPVRSLAFSPDGKRVAGAQAGMVSLWDLETATFAGDVAIPTRGQFSQLQYVADGYVLLGDLLLDVNRKIFVWRYDGFTGDKTLSNGRVWTTIKESFAERATLVSAALPHDGAKKALAALPKVPKPEWELIGKGTALTLEISVNGPQEFKAAAVELLTADLRAAGHAVADDQPVKVTVTLKVTVGTAKNEPGQLPAAGASAAGGAVAKALVYEVDAHVIVSANGKAAYDNHSAWYARPKLRKTVRNVPEIESTGTRPFDEVLRETVPELPTIPNAAAAPKMGSSAWTVNGPENR